MQLGNAWIDDKTGQKGSYDYYWTHALTSDESHAGIEKYCNFANYTSLCNKYLSQADGEVGDIDIYNIYAPLCQRSAPKSSTGSVSLSLKLEHTYMFIYIYIHILIKQNLFEGTFCALFVGLLC